MSLEGEGAAGSAPRASTLREIGATLCILGALGAAVGAPVVTRLLGTKADDVVCAQLLDRYVELRLRASRPESTPAELALAQNSARAENEHGFARCPGEVTARQASCALEAPHADQFERCLQAP